MDDAARPGQALMPSHKLKRSLHLIGGGLGLMGVLFVGVRLHDYADQLLLSFRFGFSAWICVGLLALLYGAANALLARAWWCQLAFLGVLTDWSWALKAYGVSQLAKYVPGNIFHLAGRQALGMAVGLPAAQLAKSAAWELGTLAIAGATFGVLVLPLVWPALTESSSGALFALMLIALFWAIAHWVAKPVAIAFMLQTSFLALSGLVFVATMALMTDEAQLIALILPLCGAYVLAWLAGLVTPGAPAGVGVRELVLLFLLQGQVAPGDLLLTVVLGRVVTVLGDLAFFMSMTALRGQVRPFAKNGNG